MVVAVLSFISCKTFAWAFADQAGRNAADALWGEEVNRKQTFAICDNISGFGCLLPRSTLLKVYNLRYAIEVLAFSAKIACENCLCVLGWFNISA